MEIVLKILTLVLLVGVYILYYANIHGIVKLLSDNNKFKKISYVLAAINIAMQVYIDVAPVPRQVGSVVSRMSELLIIITVFVSHRTQFLKIVYVTLLYFSVETCTGASINLSANLAVPADLSGFIWRYTYFFSCCILLFSDKPC